MPRKQSRRSPLRLSPSPPKGDDQQLPQPEMPGLAAHKKAATHGVQVMVSAHLRDAIREVAARRGNSLKYCMDQAATAWLKDMGVVVVP